METTTIGRLPLGSLAIMTVPRLGTVYALRLAQVNEGDAQIPMLLVGPKPRAGADPNSGIPHPVFFDSEAAAACILITSRPLIEPVIDEHATGIDSIRLTFGHPQGQGKLFIVGTVFYIGVADQADDLYFVSTMAWQLSRAEPQGYTAICAKWRISYLERDQDEVGMVVAKFG